MERNMADCRRFESDSDCTLTIIGDEDEVVRAAPEHTVAVQGHTDSPEMREQIRAMLVDEPRLVPGERAKEPLPGVGAGCRRAPAGHAPGPSGRAPPARRGPAAGLTGSVRGRRLRLARSARDRAPRRSTRNGHARIPGDAPHRPDKGPSMSDHPTPEHILQVGLGFWASKTLLSAIEMEVFTELARHPEDRDALSARLGLHERGARDFLDALVALGFPGAPRRRLQQHPRHRALPRQAQAVLRRRHPRDGQPPPLSASGAASPRGCAPGGCRTRPRPATCRSSRPSTPIRPACGSSSRR